MSNTVIKIENLSKLYQLGEIGTGTISHDLNRWWQTKVRGKEDPYLKVGQVNDRTKGRNTSTNKHINEFVWALKDINLEVKQGEILGIIGKNGAGKSTLLKLLSRVTSPTTGTIKTKGRLASLLEVGTGFHPEMTGRENIYMNGTIMGMRKWEITEKLDEIVEFAGVAKYLDTPTKRYSSGMTVRLGFAIAAFLEPEILVVDEVLAVGDAEFQKKAIGKMQDVSKGQGRTILFVSHNMNSISSLCERGIVLDNGQVVLEDKIELAINKYLDSGSQGEGLMRLDEIPGLDRLGSKTMGKLKEFSMRNANGEVKNTIYVGDDLSFVLKSTVNSQQLNPEIGVVISNPMGVRIHHLVSDWYGGVGTVKGEFSVVFNVKELNLYPGNYKISIWLRVFKNDPVDDFVENVQTLQVLNSKELSNVSFTRFNTNGGVYKRAEIVVT